MHRSKNPKCASEWSKIRVITRPGDVIAGGSGGMGPSSAIPAAENTHTILSKCMDYVM
jgi:hypothetical protein